MFSLSTTFVLAATLLGAFAAPTDPDVALARKFAPQFKFHKDEIYWPSTVEYFLAGVKAVNDAGQAVSQPSPISGANLDSLPNQGSGLFLSTDIAAGKGGFLRGQNPANSSPNVNTFIAKKANGVVDLYYWLFTPFNSAKSVPLLGQIGDHVGDWERLTVRTVNGEPVSVDYHAHGDTGSGTVPWAQAPKFADNRPVGYIAQGSHGLWSKAGTFTYVNAVVFQLQDVTSDGGFAWDTQNALVPLSYPDTFSGAFSWLNYKGKWGNKGTTGCWWSIFYKDCEIVDGPGGPLRDDVLGAAKVGKNFLKTTGEVLKSKMTGPLSQTLGVASSEQASSYTIRIDSEAHLGEGNTHIAVQQRCVEETKDPKKPITITTFASIALSTDNTAYTISPAACTSGLLSSYTIGLCLSESEADCTWSSAARKVRAFSTDPAVLGAQDAKAAVVDDLDNWDWE